MRRLLWFISTIAALAAHPLLVAQAVTEKTPPPAAAAPAGYDSQPNPQNATQTLPDLSNVPFAVPLPPEKTEHVETESDLLSRHGDVDLLSGDVDITVGNRHLHADRVEFNTATKEAIAEGHVRVTGGNNDEYIQASHGTYNLRTGTGRFYDVSGSVGLHNGEPLPTLGVPVTGGLVSPNPFLFAGRIVDKNGPEDYTIYDGWVTSCLLPKPDWLFSSHKLAVANGKAHASESTFHLLGLPIFFMPYLTAPVQAEQRQSGILIPVVGDSSTKGITIGEEAFITLGRSADLTVGSIYYSIRGYSESATFRYKGLGDDFLTGHFSALQDRGYIASNGVYVNQGGEDLTAAFRKQLFPNTRVVGDGEYLSSFIYREAFTSNFNQAVSSDITSIGYLTRQTDGWSMDARVDRYQGLKVVPIGSTPGEEVHILHVPSIDFDGVDHRIPDTPLLWNIDASVAGLKRVQPDFTSSGIIERIDVRPQISLPFHFDGWSILGNLASRETFYTRSREAPYSAGAAPVELTQPLNRADAEVRVEVRPPVIERTFDVPRKLQNFFGTELRHTVEPEVTYTDVRGVDNFLSVLRFDDVDLVSDTDQLEYGLTQHLYFRPKPKRAPHEPPGCPAQPASAAEEHAAAEAQQKTGAEGERSAPPTATGAAQENMTALEETVPDVLTPGPEDSTDANGIPVGTSAAAEVPTRNHARHASRCNPPAQPSQEALVSWRLTQRYFFDPTFGHAVVLHRRNIFESTLSLSGVAFLTEPRNISPLVSRLRVRTSGHTDVAWDFDYDTGAKKFTSSNVYLDAHEGPIFGGISYARLNAPGRFATEVIDTAGSASLSSSPISNFSQLRVLFGYGVPYKPGLSVATNVGLDVLGTNVQYATIQTSYNWNCCGFTVEYQKFDLGTVRDENSYKFSFTLANIGSAGNIRHAQRLF